MQKTMSATRFLQWEEKFVSSDRGSRIVHYYLKDQHGNATLAVVGTERSLRHMVYVVSNEFLHLPGHAKPLNPSFKWRSRREVVDWLTSLLSKARSSTTSSGDHTTKFSRHDASRISDTDLSNGEDMDEQDSCLNNYKGKFSRKIRPTSKGITWLGSSFTCRKRLRHYESFRRSGITISVNDYVYVMAEEKIHHIACLEDMYEDRKARKKVRVRWFHRTNEVVGSIPPPPAHVAEVFITPFRQVLSVECVDGLATILTPEHYEKCLVKLPSDVVSQIHVCSRQFDNEGIKPFNLNEMQGYRHQKILNSIDLTDPQDSSKHDLSDSLDVDEEEDADIGIALKRCPRRNRRSRRCVSSSDRICGGNAVEKSRAVSGNVFRQMEDVGADRDFNNCRSERRQVLLDSNKNTKKSCAYEQESVPFDIGDNIEVLCQDSGIRGCWFRCTITRKLPHQLKVWYRDILNEDGNGNLEEWIPSSRIATPDKLGVRIIGRPTIRPCPPQNTLPNGFEVGTVVDAWWNDGWWEGVVVMIKEPSDEVQIFFPGESVYSTFHICDLRLSKEWVHNRWVDMEKNVDLAATLVLYDASQRPEAGLHYSTLSNDFFGYGASHELGDHDHSSNRKLHIFSQVAERESRLLARCENTEDGNNDTVAMAGKGQTKVAGGHDDFMNVSKFKNMTLHDCKSNMDAFGNWTDFTGQNVSSPSDQGNQLLNVIKLESDEREACNTANDGPCSDFDLRWKSSRKRQRAGDSAFLSRSPTSCGKEESKRFNGSKLVDTDGIENDSESLLGRNTEDLSNGQEGPMEGKNLKQGHENLKPMHGASINESLFISSMPVANLVMSR